MNLLHFCFLHFLLQASFPPISSVLVKPLASDLATEMANQLDQVKRCSGEQQSISLGTFVMAFSEG